jgi:hypothetical protein
MRCGGKDARKHAGRDITLLGLVTAADLPAAEREWPGLRAFCDALPSNQVPRTFLELVWRFEQRQAPRGEDLAA